MPLSIFHCRTRLFLALIQHRTTLGGARTITVAGTASEFHTNFPPCVSVHIRIIIIIFYSQIDNKKYSYDEQLLILKNKIIKSDGLELASELWCNW